MKIAETTSIVAAADGEQIRVHKWQGEAPVRGVLQIAHGMGEHSLRYRPIAQALATAGFVVYANDHRGHGELAANMVSKVVPHDELMGAVEDMVAKILRNDRRAVESAKETIFEVIGRTLDEQLKVECLFGYALCGANPELVRRSEEFLAKQDKGRAGVNATSL